MAIKVCNTTVIDNSRQLSNISAIDQTTADAIGELVPKAIVVDSPVVGGGTLIPNAAAGGDRTIEITLSADSALLDGVISSFEVNWADGSSSETVSATNEAATVSHTYPSDQTDGTQITITVVAIDDKGNRSASVDYTATYVDNQPPGGTIVNNYSTTWSTDDVITCFDVTFSGATDPDGTICYYAVTNISEPTINGGITVDSVCKSSGTAHRFCVPACYGSAGTEYTLCYNVYAIDNLEATTPTCQMTHTLLWTPEGEASYTTPGSYTWTAPAGVCSVSVVAVGGGGHGAGNNDNVHNFESQDSYFISNTCVAGLRGHYSRGCPNDGNNLGGGYAGDGGGCGGCGNNYGAGSGGGGAGGYCDTNKPSTIYGCGGCAVDGACNSPCGQSNGCCGWCGGGGGGGGGTYYYHNHNGGGGVGIMGIGTSGPGGCYNAAYCVNNGGSGGGQGFAPPDETWCNGSANGTGGFGGYYGGGGGATLTSNGGGGGGLGWKNNIAVTPEQGYAVCVGYGGDNDDGGNQEGGHGGKGAVRIIWGSGRTFPDNAS